MRKKEKWTNKGNDKHEDADWIILSCTIQQFESFVQTFKILGLIVPKKSDTNFPMTYI